MTALKIFSVHHKRLFFEEVLFHFHLILYSCWSKGTHVLTFIIYLPIHEKGLLLPILGSKLNVYCLNNSQYSSYLNFVSKGQYLLEMPLQSRHPWIYHISNCNKLCEHSFQCTSINNCDTNICHLKGARSKYGHYFAITETFDCNIKI